MKNDKILRSNTQEGILSIIEYLVRSVPFLYIIARKIVRFTNIFEEDANGVKELNFKRKKINIIDIGASDGIASKFFIKNLIVNKVYCFEPNIHFCKIIKKNLKFKNTKVIIKNMAIGNKTGRTKIFVPNYIFFGKKFPLITYTFYDKKKCLDQIKKDFINYKKFNVKQEYLKIIKPPKFREEIDLIKIDINGNEYDTLLSLKNLIKKDRPALLIEGLDDMKKIKLFLNKYDYNTFIYKKKLLKNDNFNVSLNYYFLQKYHIKKIKF